VKPAEPRVLLAAMDRIVGDDYGFPLGEGAMSSTSLSAFMSTGFTMW
jgi:hypothetical protein